MMLKHLIYCIPRKFKVGYGALFTKIFENFGIDVKSEPILPPRDENLFGSHSLLLLRFTVVNGKIAEKVEEVSSDETPLAAKKVKKDKKEKDVAEKVVEDKTEEVHLKKGKTVDETEEKKGKSGGTSKRKAASHHKGTRPLKRRVVRKTADVGTEEKKSSPVEETQAGQEHLDETMEQPSAAMPRSLERIEQMFQLVMAKLLDLQSEQQSLKESLTISVAQLEDKLATLQQTVLEKIDSITVEEVSVDDASIPTTAPSVSLP